MGLKGYPSVAEDCIIDRDIRIAEFVGAGIHICHVTTAAGAEIIRAAKARGALVTGEVTPHHIALTEDACRGYNTLAKVNPPLRAESDRRALIAALADGTIDVIATDHAPHHPDEKSEEFERAANGTIGFETAFAVAYTHLVKPGILTLPQLVQKMSSNPRRILSLPPMSFSPGDPADFSLCDLEEKWTVNPALFLSRAKNSVFSGVELFGKIKKTFLGGVLLYASE
jgi:dihydroorotase